MTHSVQLIIGNGPPVQAFLQGWPGSRAVELKGGWLAIPVDEALADAIAARSAGAVPPDLFDLAPPGLSEALVSCSAAGGGLAYVETDYWGGQGTQAAMAAVDGAVAVEPQTSRIGAINEALRAIGVTAIPPDDAFDTIGLGARRTMADYEPAGPVRLRGQAPEPQENTAPAEKAFVPLWQIALLIAAAIAVGILVAVTS